MILVPELLNGFDEGIDRSDSITQSVEDAVSLFRKCLFARQDTWDLTMTLRHLSTHCNELVKEFIPALMKQ